MPTTTAKSLYRELAHNVDQEVHLEGWVRTIRASNTVGFIEFNDGTFFRNVQIVFDNTLADFATITKLAVASAIGVRGVVVATPGAKQPFEIKASEITVEAGSDSDYPLQKKRHSLEFLREIAHLRPRSNLFSAVFRVRSVAAHAIHSFFQEQGFVYIHSPIITSSDAEGAGAMFRVTTLDLLNPPKTAGRVDHTQDFFGKETFLSVSGQLEAEIFALAFKNVYTFGPTFRAENSHTARHAAEFWMIEPELAFADLADNMDNIEALVKYIVKYVLRECPEEMEFFNQYVEPGLLERLEKLVELDFVRLDYSKAIAILQESGKDFVYPPSWEDGLQTEHERYLCEEVYQRPVFVTNYPKGIKSFYMRLNDDGITVAATDLLVPSIGELVGASQREERLDVLVARMNELGMQLEPYWWYLELRKYGGVKHAGYGLGFERLIMYLTGVSNVRDVIPCPRTVGNLKI
ncbi:MAG: asparagine--tRNA ligase [Firmicutes bacterium]|nr:asparagine--tRNA ligase [Dethiobacter sp.]MBS3887896.1 asparagine--tRNA ligase [Bacillota bacterium]MBS4053858.1 asparagine--tRNA ligase [Thermaerobacter sp.]